jgi:hypothetical protein
VILFVLEDSLSETGVYIDAFHNLPLQNDLGSAGTMIGQREQLINENGGAVHEGTDLTKGYGLFTEIVTKCRRANSAVPQNLRRADCSTGYDEGLLA